MLSDPLFITSIPPSSLSVIALDLSASSIPDATTVRIADIGDGSSRRVGTYNDVENGTKTTLTISGAPSKENGQVPTRRTLIRMDREVLTSEGVRAVVSAYAVAVVPTIPGVTGIADGAELVRNLAAFLLLGGGNATATNFSTADTNTLSRILLGEP
jgi:hypothetical protein